MERLKRPYSLQKRPAAKNRYIYYVKFRDASGAYGTAISSGCTRRDEALLWAEGRQTGERERRQNITLAAYVLGFWEPDAPFASDRAAHGRAVCLTHLDIAEGYTRNHLLPRWGGWRLRDITAKKVDDWVVELHREGELAPATINKLLQTLRTILDRAVLDGWLPENPARNARPVRATRPGRSILSVREAARLLAGPDYWGDFRHYAINLLAATTGLRMGEVRALLVENVHDDHVEVRYSWEQGYGPRPPKADSVRDVPISPKVTAVLARVIDETRPDSLVFYGRAGKDSPMSKSVIEDHLALALEAIGISLVEQRERNITFHAWRHFLNTLLRSNGVADAKTRRITGHRTEAMTSWYTDWKAVDISEVVDIQSSLFVM
jgi:integrase